MFDFLDKIRGMPVSSRRKAAALAALLFTALLFVIWLGFGPLGPLAGSSKESVKDETPSPLSATVGSLRSVWDKMLAQISSVGNQFNELERQIEGLASSTIATTASSSPEDTKKPENNEIIIVSSFATTSFSTSTSLRGD